MFECDSEGDSVKICCKSKDGGDHSKVVGYFLFEAKKLGSIVLLRFDEGSREAFHTHAFNAISWVLAGKLRERLIDGTEYMLTPSIMPVYTERERFHRVFGESSKTYVLSFRGPWRKVWREYLPAEDREIKLTNGRIEIQ